MTNERLSKLQIHLLMASLYFVAFTVSVTIKLFGGEVFSNAPWHSITGVRPYEWLMLVIVWWAVANSYNSGAGKRRDLGSSSPS